MEQIRGGGKQLRHVTSEDRAKARPERDSRDELLDQIRTGVTLKKVDPDSLHHHRCVCERDAVLLISACRNHKGHMTTYSFLTLF